VRRFSGPALRVEDVSRLEFFKIVVQSGVLPTVMLSHSESEPERAPAMEEALSAGRYSVEFNADGIAEGLSGAWTNFSTHDNLLDAIRSSSAFMELAKEALGIGRIDDRSDEKVETWIRVMDLRNHELVAWVDFGALHIRDNENPVTVVPAGLRRWLSLQNMTSNPTLSESPDQAEWLRFLDGVMADFGCATGTLHRLDPADNLLKLVVCRGIPDQLLPIISTIPIGKGIAGAAAERLEPVELCNLQTDTSGVAKPGAKQTNVQGSLAVPALHGGQLRGTLGVGKTVPHDFTEEEKNRLLAFGATAAARLG